MSSQQLDILALEPFFGGIRRHMLETIIRCSRHRWTLLKLPPRRMERRLTGAANWFGEHLARHWAGNMDVVFTSDAMNLGSLYRLVPHIAHPPSVVYFHDNQFTQDSAIRERKKVEYSLDDAVKSNSNTVVAPPPVRPPPRKADLEVVNLNTATAATEIWFNCAAHVTQFVDAVGKLCARHAELSTHNPVATLNAKARIVPPPMDLHWVPQIKTSNPDLERDPRAIFVDTRDAQVGMLNAALTELAKRKEKFRLITVGPVEDLSPAWPRRTISESDDFGQIVGLLEASTILSVRPKAWCDLPVVRGLQAGCRPVLPNSGIYTDLIPKPLHGEYLYGWEATRLADQLQEAVDPTLEWGGHDFSAGIKLYDAMAATKIIDDRLTQLAATPPAH